jgi:hypothetical protein
MHEQVNKTATTTRKHVLKKYYNWNIDYCLKLLQTIHLSVRFSKFSTINSTQIQIKNCFSSESSIERGENFSSYKERVMRNNIIIDGNGRDINKFWNNDKVRLSVHAEVGLALIIAFFTCPKGESTSFGWKERWITRFRYSTHLSLVVSLICWWACNLTCGTK